MAFNRAVDTIEEDTKPRTKFVRNYEWFKLEPGHQAIYRFLTEGDEILSVRSHQSIPTKPKPADAKGKWPSALPAVCRYDPAFEGIHSDCYVCDEKVENPRNGKPISASPRYWALAVEREEVREGGILKGYRNVMVEREVDGKKVQMPKIVVFNLGAKNFFTAFLTFYKMGGSVTDQDFKIGREGEELATQYIPFGLGQERNAKGIVYSKKNTPDWWDENFGHLLEDLSVDLEEIISEQASDDRYARFFDPRVAAPKRVEEDSEPAWTPPQDDSVDPTDLHAMRERVKSYR